MTNDECPTNDEEENDVAGGARPEATGFESQRVAISATGSAWNRPHCLIAKLLWYIRL